jgi:hypothetical protein
MPQMLRIALSDSLSYNSITNEGGPVNNFRFSRFRRIKINSGLGVI